MKKYLIRTNISPVLKITLSALFIALIVILQKVLAINYIPLVPFLRISFGGPALIIFSSILLGPIYGLVIGVASDIVGYFIFDPKTMGFFPQVTAIYGVLGFLSYFIFVAVRLLKNKRVMQIIEYSVFALLFVCCTLFISLNDSITLYSQTYEIVTWQKITIPIILFVLFAILVVCTILTERYFQKKHQKVLNVFNTYQVSFSCFVIEVVVMILFGSLMKGYAFGFQTYLVILITQILVAFFNIPLNTFLISYIMIFTNRYFTNVQDTRKES